MPRCVAELAQWKQRRAVRLSNGRIELTVLIGGGHVADLRLCGSPINALWEASWPTIEPFRFSDDEHTELYGERPVGQMLSGYSGHALALGYFGMPSPEQAKRGLALHGEAASEEWQLQGAYADAARATVTLEVELPRTNLHFRRTLSLAAEAQAVAIHETTSNRSPNAQDIQWVQHVAFGEPLFFGDEASLSLSGTRGLTWPLGYEGHALLPDNQLFEWPTVPSDRGDVDLSRAFSQDGTGFVAAVRTDPRRAGAFIAVHNHQLGLAAGYVFDAQCFPWICLWEENRARNYPPWNGATRVRGVEFGTSPMPLGLQHAQQMRTLFDTPVLARIEGDAQLSTTYDLFVTAVPQDWASVPRVSRDESSLVLHSDAGKLLQIVSSR